MCDEFDDLAVAVSCAANRVEVSISNVAFEFKCLPDKS